MSLQRCRCVLPTVVHIVPHIQGSCQCVLRKNVSNFHDKNKKHMSFQYIRTKKNRSRSTAGSKTKKDGIRRTCDKAGSPGRCLKRRHGRINLPCRFSVFICFVCTFAHFCAACYRDDTFVHPCLNSRRWGAANAVCETCFAKIPLCRHMLYSNASTTLLRYDTFGRHMIYPLFYDKAQLKAILL